MIWTEWRQNIKFKYYFLKQIVSSININHHNNKPLPQHICILQQRFLCVNIISPSTRVSFVCAPFGMELNGNQHCCSRPHTDTIYNTLHIYIARSRQVRKLYVDQNLHLNYMFHHDAAYMLILICQMWVYKYVNVFIFRKFNKTQ